MVSPRDDPGRGCGTWRRQVLHDDRHQRLRPRGEESDHEFHQVSAAYCDSRRQRVGGFKHVEREKEKETTRWAQIEIEMEENKKESF